MSYWLDRQQKMQARVADKTIEETQKQLARYYKSAMNKVIEDFVATYDKLLATVAADKEPTPADLYKLDRYWQMQRQLKKELEDLGLKEIAAMSEAFEKEWGEIYERTALPTAAPFGIIDNAGAKAMIDTVWLPDGKTYSQRIWKNINYLSETLNDNLIHCINTGKKTTELRELLESRFNVSRSQANTLIRTEAAHIQTQAAAQKYQDYGLKKYVFFADTDEKTCKHGSPSCEDLDGEVFLYSEMQAGKNAPPMHPNCRCTIKPYIEDESEKDMDNKVCKYCGKPITSGAYCKDCKDKAMSFKYYSPDTNRYQTASWFMKKGATEQDIMDYYFNLDKDNWMDFDLPDGREAFLAYAAQLEREMAAEKGVSKYRYYKKKKELDELLYGKGLIDYVKPNNYAKASDDKKTSYMAQNYNICKDCGKAYKVDGKNNRSERCPECQEKYRKEYKAKKAREYRKKKKKK